MDRATKTYLNTIEYYVFSYKESNFMCRLLRIKYFLFATTIK
jgi:hypothetical protein